MTPERAKPRAVELPQKSMHLTRAVFSKELRKLDFCVNYKRAGVEG